ncbi:putative ABC transport system permease protein [Saccharopolyspora antimicrobica]|uniref:ABC transport system permease protein n=1 Tax=Saccharopolyspora antimicrobica TaxID=455193 RepID=A0A1I4RE20_9PSEU|nr:ABC transporter permease [Saccharopolyspora antimicrobica]RKT88048.1 putative ABC transport system permease protein [Saccharopolyspora antimicrobica]SFM50455.1 putative ABC transport system permease protein [Saccharopolyspora antimicrobica]
MFLAIRDIRFAKGRFALMGSVVGLITLLIVLLSGLTAGLAHQSTSAITQLPATHIAFGAADGQAPEKSFADSSVTAEQLAAYRAAPGVRWAVPLGITQTRLDTPAGGASATVFGVTAEAGLSPAAVVPGELVISRELAEEAGLAVGQRVQAGVEELRIGGIVDDSYYSHTPVAWTALETWSQLRPSRADAAVATVIAADLSDPAAADAAAGTASETLAGSLAGIGSYSSENGSLLMMQSLLYAISALVIGAFMTVWTIQRSGDIAVLKALGGATGYLLRDALAQSVVVLLLGAGLGGAVGVGLGALASQVVPFQLTAATTVLPVALMIVLGMIGAVLAVRRITSVDPLTALGAAR